MSALNIPIATTFKSTFFNTSEISLIISILKVVSNYKDDVALVIVLKNLFEFDEEQLFAIRNSGEFRYFHECMDGYSTQDDIFEKIKALKTFINTSRYTLEQKTIYDYLKDVMDDFGIITKIRSEKDGEDSV